MVGAPVVHASRIFLFESAISILAELVVTFPSRPHPPSFFCSCIGPHRHRDHRSGSLVLSHPSLLPFTTVSQRSFGFHKGGEAALELSDPPLVVSGSSTGIDGNRNPSKGCDGSSIPRRVAQVEVPANCEADDGAAKAPRARRSSWFGYSGSCGSGGERSEPQRV